MWLFEVSPLLVSPPSQIAEKLVEMLLEEDLLGHTRLSLLQFSLGYFSIVLFAVPLGLLIGMNTYARDIADPWITALYATPVVALAPLFLIWLGFGIASKAAVVALVAFFPIVINTAAGVRHLDPRYVEVARTYRANQHEIFWKILLPGSLPYIFAGLRLAVGRGLVGIVVADLFGARAGLGYLIVLGSQNFDTSQVFVGVIILAMFGVLFTGLLKAAERWRLPWLTQADSN